MKFSGIAFLIALSVSTTAMVKGTAEFIAKANPGFLEIQGKGGIVDGSKATVKDNMMSGSFLLNLKDLKTGIDQRDDHMQGYLQSDKYPIAAFKLDPVSIVGGSKKAFSGSLTLHGVTKKISGVVDLSTVGKAIAKFDLDVTSYGIQPPVYRLLTVGKDISVTVTLDLP